MLLKDRVAIVTGSGGSIGGAVCRRLAFEGADVCLAARRATPELASEIRALLKAGRPVFDGARRDLERKDVLWAWF